MYILLFAKEALIPIVALYIFIDKNINLTAIAVHNNK